MNIPPLLMRLKTIDGDHRVNLWLPLFLVWILLLAIAIALSPVVCILAIILWPFGWGETLVLSGPALYRMVCSLRGLSVDIRKPNQVVLMYFK
jgi:hypothetical protein